MDRRCKSQVSAMARSVSSLYCAIEPCSFAVFAVQRQQVYHDATDAFHMTSSLNHLLDKFPMNGLDVKRNEKEDMRCQETDVQ